MPGFDWSLPAMFAYMGLGSGVELIPYFVALLSFVGAALIAVVQRPLILMIRWLRKSKSKQEGGPPAETGNDPSRGVQHAPPAPPSSAPPSSAPPSSALPASAPPSDDQ